jgi:hypothetical protein
MKDQPEIDAEFYVILETPCGLRMTVSAQPRLDELRIKRDRVIRAIELFSGDVSSWVPSRTKTYRIRLADPKGFLVASVGNPARNASAVLTKEKCLLLMSLVM